MIGRKSEVISRIEEIEKVQDDKIWIGNEVVSNLGKVKEALYEVNERSGKIMHMEEQMQEIVNTRVVTVDSKCKDGT